MNKVVLKWENLISQNETAKGAVAPGLVIQGTDDLIKDYRFCRFLHFDLWSEVCASQRADWWLPEAGAGSWGKWATLVKKYKLPVPNKFWGV